MGRRPRLGGGRDRAPEDAAEHRLCELSGEGVLLAGMIGREDFDSPDRPLAAVGEARLRARDRRALPGE
jgi:hypothetical protein